MDPEKIDEADDNTKTSQLADTKKLDVSSLTAHQKVTILVASASTGFLLIAVTILAIVLHGLPDTSGGVCRNLSESIRTGIPLDIAPNPIYYNLCGLNNCTFDVQICSDTCLFGYTTNSRGCPINCECGTNGLFEGDIHFSDEDAASLRHFLTPAASTLDPIRLQDPEYLRLFQIPTWGHGRESIVPIIIDTDFGTEIINQIRSHLDDVAMKTCITIKDHQQETDFLYIYSGTQCSADFGRKKGQTNMVLHKDHCVHKASVQHLFMHVLGFYHETTRPDRDEHIDIIEYNVLPDKKHNFEKFNNMHWMDYGVEYNPMSLLHYPSEAFSVAETRKTITGKNGQKVRGDSTDDLYLGMQSSDILKINILYRCLGSEDRFDEAQWEDWTQWTSSDRPNSKCVRMRTCLRKKDGKVGVCLNQDAVSAKYEISEKPRPCSDIIGRLSQSMSRDDDEDIVLNRQPRNADITFNEPVTLSHRICPNGRLLTGKFDSDIFSDLLCLYGDGYIRIYLGSDNGLYEQLNWEGSTPFCRYGGDSSKIYSADLNRDGLSDLVCHRKTGIIEAIILKNGYFTPFLDWSGTLTGCEGTGKRIYTADVNGDGQADILCGDDADFHVSHIFLNVYKSSGLGK